MSMSSGAVLREAEPRLPPERNLDLIDEIATRIRPDDPGLEEWLSRYYRQHRQRLASDLCIVEQHLEPESRILEYGAIPLLLTGALRELGYNLSAVDISPERFAGPIAALGLDITRCDVEIEPVPFAAETFDAVLFNELFEHLRIDPIFTLAEARRVLKPNGSLLLSTPNLRSLRGIRNLLLHNQGHAASAGVYEQYEKLETLGHMGHVREYTTREVSDFLARVGFRVDKLIFRGGHGRGAVGLVERLMPSLRPFFTLRATKTEPQTSIPGAEPPSPRSEDR
jgi:SAM-dependent methyltransferase